MDAGQRNDEGRKEGRTEKGSGRMNGHKRPGNDRTTDTSLKTLFVCSTVDDTLRATFGTTHRHAQRQVDWERRAGGRTEGEGEAKVGRQAG